MIGKYNLLSVPFLSFFSKNAYREVGKNWRGVNLVYLFLLLAICCLPPTLSWRKHFLQSLDSNQVHIINQIPDIRISNGQVTLNQRQPYVITRNDGTTAIIIDTTGSLNYIDDPNVIALLMESSLIVRSGENTFNTIDLSGISDFHFDKFIANDWLNMARNSLAPVSYGIFLMLSYIFALLVMLLAAVLGLILSHAMHGTLSFASALRLATVAASPSIIFMTISAALGIGISTEIHLAVTMIYLIIGIKACAKPGPAEKEEHVDLKACLHEDDEDLPEVQHAA